MRLPSEDTDALGVWLQQRAKSWKTLEELTKSVAQSKESKVSDIATLSEGYRSLIRDLALARITLPDSRVTRYLEVLVFDIHQQIYEPASSFRHNISSYICNQLPKDVELVTNKFIFCAVLFIASAIIGWVLISFSPELISIFASEKMINEVQQGNLWTDGLLNIVPSSVLSFQIMTNNIIVAITAFTLGIFYMLGTVYMIGLNGLMLGAVFAYTSFYDLDHRLFEFVIAHGIVELSIICLAGALGIQIGESIIRPGNQSRTKSFQVAAKQTMGLVIFCIGALILAGLIEGYISPDPAIALSSKISVGIIYASLLLLLLSGRLCSFFGGYKSLSKG